MTAGLITIFLCLLASAFFAGSETAITGLSRARLYHLIQEGRKNALRVGELRKQKESLLSAMLLGNSAVNILASAVATDLAIESFGQDGVAYVTLIMTFLIVVFGEVLPKTYAILNAETVALGVSRPLWWVFKLLYPFTRAIQAIIRPILLLLGMDAGGGDTSDVSASDVIRGTVELHHEEGKVAKQQRDMLGTILDLDEIRVGEVMTHRINLESLDIGQPVETLISEAIRSTHTRLPVWRERPENIVGVLHIKRLLKELREQKTLGPDDVQSLLVKPWFIPDATTLKEQLQAFRLRRQHLALVVDEYGELRGMVTLEDILEEIVGKIDDEHDWSMHSEIVPVGQHHYQVEGTTTIRDLNRQLDWDLPDDRAATVAGLILDEARVIPDIGDSFDFHGVRFTVRGRSGNQITRVLAEKLPEAEGGDSR